MSALKEDLSQFRKQIDEIDAQIVDLLKKRLLVVKEVAKHKEKTSKTASFIRAGREADMLRNLTSKLSGDFPAEAVATIWRMIISTSLAVEQNMNVSAYVTKNDNSSFWQAREYYGSFVPIDVRDSSEQVIADVVEGRAAVGSLPLMDDSKTPWWVRPKQEKNDVFVFARTPFIENKNDVKGSTVKPCLAIANVMPESTNDDISLFAVYASQDENSVVKTFLAENIEVKLLAATDSGNFLFETNKFIASDDESLKRINNKLEGESFIRLLGSYAAPIKL